jgi:hypothetical protein
VPFRADPGPGHRRDRGAIAITAEL